jgi:hypothetical protein
MKGTTNKRKMSHKNQTRKQSLPIINGKILQENHEGWKIIEIHGDPYERGFAHGYLLHQEITTVLKKLPFAVNHEIEVSYRKYLATCKRIISPIIKQKSPEIYQELCGISRGAQMAGQEISVHTLIAWNAFMSMYNYFHYDVTSLQSTKKRKSQRCSAFIATGKATKNGKIVMAHNSHSDLVSGSLFNIIMYLTPKQGFPFCMQTAPGYVASGTDWFLSESGMMGCETTIGDTNYQPNFKDGHLPYFCRIRQAMQYGKNLDEYAKIMTQHNAGDYAGSWLFGDTKTNEIMLCEIGLNIQNIQRTNDGIFYGMNSAMSFELRDKETNDQDFFDITTSSGARNYRLYELLYKTYYGKLTTENAKKILSDHYNVLSQKNDVSNSNSVCVHTYNDSESDYYPHGCQDGKVVDAEMAKRGEFVGRWGPSCGTPFDTKKFVQEHPEYKEWERVLVDFPKKEWVRIHS